ncbi:MAG: GTP-binding protein, partial [Pseudomonadota bacterium]
RETAIRAKGRLRFSESDRPPMRFDQVGTRQSLAQEKGAIPDNVSVIVAIGAREMLDPERLQSLFERAQDTG